MQTYTHGPTNHAHFFIGLVPRGQRKFTHQQMATKVRGILGEYHNVTYNVRLPSVLGGEIYFPISAVIRGPDLNQLAETSKKVADKMRQYPDLVDINPSLNLNTPELQVKVDRQRAADIGVRMTDISDAVRLFYSGEDEITRFKEGSEQYPVTMQLLPEQRDNPDVLNRMMVPSSKLGQVRLESVATIGRGFGPATLWRYNREFQVSVYANVASGYPLDLAAAHTIGSIKEVGLPAGYSYLFSGQVKVLEETTWNLLLAMLLASVFMYMVLAAQFESFSYPFIIMLTLPLSIPFRALLALDYGTRLEPVERAGNVSAAGNCEEERNPAGRLHQPAGGARHAGTRRHPRSESRATAPDPDDYAFYYRGAHSCCHRHRRGLGTEGFDRCDHHRRADALPAADFAGGAGRLLVSGGVENRAVAAVGRPRSRTDAWRQPHGWRLSIVRVITSCRS